MSELNDKDKKDLEIAVEHSTTLASVEKTMKVAGLEDVPTSMIPVPFYKLVQPGSTNVSLSDGKDAIPGHIFMSDTGNAVETLRFLLLRAKRQRQPIMDDSGNAKYLVRMAILGLNLDRMTPFILGVSVSSFNGFGQLMAQIKGAKVTKAWERAITVTSEKKEEKKQTDKGLQMVKYWVLNFSLEDKKISKDEMEMAESAFSEFAASLDRNQEDEIPDPVEDNQLP